MKRMILPLLAAMLCLSACGTSTDTSEETQVATATMRPPYVTTTAPPDVQGGYATITMQTLVVTQTTAVSE